MTRFKLLLEYNGGPYVGWQRQKNGHSVQAALETAARAFCGKDIAVHGAGRTDAGVHALGQVAHIDIAQDRDSETVLDALNHFLIDERSALPLSHSQSPAASGSEPWPGLVGADRAGCGGHE
jgi:tRNA pseudouridine38-40 synthase